VSTNDGFIVGESVGDSVGGLVSTIEGLMDGLNVGDWVGMSLLTREGLMDGFNVGDWVGMMLLSEGDSEVGVLVGVREGEMVGMSAKVGTVMVGLYVGRSVARSPRNKMGEVHVKSAKGPTLPAKSLMRKSFMYTALYSSVRNGSAMMSSRSMSPPRS
jgi:hypothetical protein